MMDLQNVFLLLNTERAEPSRAGYERGDKRRTGSIRAHLSFETSSNRARARGYTKKVGDKLVLLVRAWLVLYLYFWLFKKYKKK